MRAIKNTITQETQLINYEAHVGDFTEKCIFIPENIRGKFLGICHPYIIKHLKKMGVNCIQLMPVFAKDDTHWGYGQTSWSKLNPDFATVEGEEEKELKLAIKTLQENGIKVILDIVFNHVASESKQDFEKSGVKFYDFDVTGCGNTVNVPKSLPEIMKVIDYWLRDVGIDGFRFDLGDVMGMENGIFTKEAKFFKEIEQYKDKILIFEPWSCTSYSLDKYPDGVIMLNDNISHAVRQGGTLYCGVNYKSYMGFGTYHDGFTLNDLVSYNRKHNERNGENNRDGNDNNYSNNHGVEGATDNQWIIDERKKTKINILKNLIISSYHITILMGDELERTQNGCNNGYKHKCPVEWSQYDQKAEWFKLYCDVLKGE